MPDIYSQVACGVIALFMAVALGFTIAHHARKPRPRRNGDGTYRGGTYEFRRENDK